MDDATGAKPQRALLGMAKGGTRIVLLRSEGAVATVYSVTIIKVKRKKEHKNQPQLPQPQPERTLPPAALLPPPPDFLVDAAYSPERPAAPPEPPLPVRPLDPTRPPSHFSTRVYIGEAARTGDGFQN